METIILVEDDHALNKIVSQHLRTNSFNVISCYEAKDAYDQLTTQKIDLIISDIMMPRIDGFDLAESIRDLDENIPILFVSARDDFLFKKKGFSLGIDDYMVKPIDLDELVWRINALLRRSQAMKKKQIEIGNLILNAAEMNVICDGKEIPVTVREFNILFKLLSYPKQTFSREQLLDEFWGMESDSSLRSVDVYINRLREKFSDCSYFDIKTVYGLGYKVIVHE